MAAAAAAAAWTAHSECGCSSTAWRTAVGVTRRVAPGRQKTGRREGLRGGYEIYNFTIFLFLHILFLKCLLGGGEHEIYELQIFDFFLTSLKRQRLFKFPGDGKHVLRWVLELYNFTIFRLVFRRV